MQEKDTIRHIHLSSKGQVVIPEEFRESLQLRKGSNLVCIKHGNSIIIKKQATVLKQMEDEFKDIEAISFHALRDIWENEKDDIWNSYLDEP